MTACIKEPRKEREKELRVLKESTNSICESGPSIEAYTVIPKLH